MRANRQKQDRCQAFAHRTAILVVSAMAAFASSASAQTPPPVWSEIPPPSGTYRQHQTGYRTDTVNIPVRANGGEIEYMLRMKQGDTAVYTWQVVDMAKPDMLTSEFHGHTDRVGNAPGTLVFYRKATGGSESGALTAPFPGIHGWYLKNDSEKPIVVRLTVAGFYELIPDQIP